MLTLAQSQALAYSDVELQIPLVGATLNGMTPSGEAKSSIRGDGSKRFNAEAEHVNLPVGTILNVFVDNAKVGTLILNSLLTGEIELDSKKGNTVPAVNSTSRVVIATLSGSTVVAGTFSPTATPTPTPGGSPTPTPTPSTNEGRIKAMLAGAAINGLTPKGEAELRTRADGRRKFKVEAEKVNMPVGSVLNVLVDGNNFGTIVLGITLEGEMELESEHGQVIPNVINGTSVVVTNQNGATILSGTFNISAAPIAAVNDIDDSGFFVQRHYHDFLDREPDDNGMDFWRTEIENCAGDNNCVEMKRVNTSGAFFLSIEFQNTGYLVYRFNKASFGTMPRRLEFLKDMQLISQGVIVNSQGWEAKLEDNKRAAAEDWVNRPEFKNIFDSKTNEEYVDQLYANAGVAPTNAERDVLVNGLHTATETRATVLRKVADNQRVQDKEYNSAFVLMQYFGYLHRNPNEGPDTDMSGFNFWLGKLNQFGGDFTKAEMVKAFILAGEYRGRFN
jgi:hypothetical protein